MANNMECTHDVFPCVTLQIDPGSLYFCDDAPPSGDLVLEVPVTIHVYSVVPFPGHGFKIAYNSRDDTTNMNTGWLVYNPHFMQLRTLVPKAALRFNIQWDILSFSLEGARSIAKMPVKFQSDGTILDTNLAASRLCEILQSYVVSEIETEPWYLGHL